MPSVSDKQKVAMAIACHDPEKSTSGIPQDVACDFNRADAAKQKRAKRKVKEAVEYLETLKMIEDVRNMSFTNFLVESSGKSQAPDALSLISQIENEATQAVQANTPGGQTFFDRVRQALRDSNLQSRLMSALRARDAYRATNEGLTQEEADELIMIEAVSIPADASFAEVEKMYKAALRGRALADKLKDSAAKKKHKSRTTGNFNTLAARYKKMKAAQEVKESLTEWTLSDVRLALKGNAAGLAKVKEMQKMGKDNYTRADLRKHGLGDLMVDVPRKESTETDGDVLEEKKKPSAGLNKKQKARIEKKAHSGKNVYGGGFNKIEKKAEEKYGSKKAGKKVAASIMWKKARKNAKVRESVEFADAEVDFIVESAFEFQKMQKKMNKVFEKYLDPADYDDKETIIKIAMEHGAEKVDGFEVMTEDEKMDLIFETCMKYDLAEAFDVNEPEDHMDDPEAFAHGADPADQDVAPPQTSVSKSNFKLDPTDIGRVAEIIAKYSDFPPEDRNLAGAVEKLQYADLFHLTPPEVVVARRLLAHAANDVGA